MLRILLLSLLLFRFVVFDLGLMFLHNSCQHYVGVVESSGVIDLSTIVLILMVAAILGNVLNYHIGRYLDPLVFKSGKIKFLKKEHLDKTHAFYGKHGGKTIMLARFLPVIRTFAPFIAGIGKMNYLSFWIYNVIGSCAWVGLCVLAGFYFGNISWVQGNLNLIVLFVLVMMVVLAILAYLGTRVAAAGMHNKKEALPVHQYDQAKSND